MNSRPFFSPPSPDLSASSESKGTCANRSLADEKVRVLWCLLHPELGQDLSLVSGVKNLEKLLEIKGDQRDRTTTYNV